MLHSTILGVLSLGWLTLVTSRALGERLSAAPRLTRLLFGGSWLFLFLTLVISGAYYVGRVTPILFTTAIAFVAGITILVGKPASIEDTRSERERLGIVNLALLLGYFASYGLLLTRLIERRTGDLVMHFWTIPGRLFWALFLFQTIIAIVLCLREARFRTPLIVSHLFLQVSLAAIVYVHGYGFDPFLHEAAIRTIQETGTLLPKTPYYIGAYGLVAFLSWTTTLSVNTILHWLGPVTFAILPPLTLATTPFFQTAPRRGTHAVAGFLGLSLVPISMYLMTTPQGLVYVLALVTILLSFEQNANQRFWRQLPFVVIALSIHPFLSLSLAAYSAFQWLLTNTTLLARISRWALVAANIFIYPVLLLVAGYQQTRAWTVSLQSPFSFLKLPQTHEYYHPATDLFFATGVWYIPLLWMIALWAIVITYKRRSRLFFVSTTFAAVHLASFFLLLIIRPSGLLNDLNYLELIRRVLDLSWLFLLPLVLEAFEVGIAAIRKERSILVGSSAVVTILLLIAARLYTTYPVRTDYLYTRGFQRTSDDVSTVELVSQTNGSYVVLGHQPLAAEAIRARGFFAYRHGEFVYSIPSANKDGLSRRYEELIAHPSVTVLERVQRDFQVDHVIVVIPSYWTGGSQAVAALKAQGLTPRLSSPRGQNTIFVFSASSDSLAK